MTQQLIMNPQDLEALNKLCALINFGANSLASAQINRRRLSLKQDLLLLIFAPVNSYGESIYVLLKDFRPDSAIVLLRALVEAYINTAYILSHNSENRAWKFILEENFNTLGMINEAMSFYKRYPALRPNDEKFTENSLLGLQRKIKETQIKALCKLKININSKKKFRKKYPEVFDLSERAKALDRRNKKGTFEYWYLMIYRYFSEYTHLSMRGISHFFSQRPDGLDAQIGQSDRGLGIIILTTFHIYLFFLEKLKQYRILNLKLSPHQKIYSDLHKNFKNQPNQCP